MKCENCGKDHDGSYGSGRFYCQKCARGYSTKEKRKVINNKVSVSLAGRKSYISVEKRKVAALRAYESYLINLIY